MSDTQLPIMAHLVLGFPTLAESIRTAEQYVKAGTAILELQIPFSHPTADGPIITAACQQAIEQKVTVSDCLQAVRTLREKYPEQEMIVMSYLNRVYVYGFEKFQKELKALGVRHLIVPDLPAPSPPPPPKGRGASSRDNVNSGREEAPLPFGGWDGDGAVPVLAANTPDTRLSELLAAGYDFFYLMSDFKITGSTFSLHPRLREMVAQIKAHDSKNRVGIGFGIETPEQVLAVLDVADYAIIGSALIRAQQENRLDIYLENLRKTLMQTTIIA